MPVKPMQVCGRGPCLRVALPGQRYCAEHEQQQQQANAQRTAKRDALIGNSHSRGYGNSWRIAAKAFLRDHPLCVECTARGRTVLASLVDHIRPHAGDQQSFWDQSNWQALCASCHGRKTATHDRGFGNPGRGDQISTAFAKRPRASDSLAQSLNSGGESWSD